MNKLWAIPILTALILSVGLFIGLTGAGFNLEDVENETNGQIIVNSASLDKSNMEHINGFLNLEINATFLEDIESIKINGVLHDKDGSYSNVDFHGKPNNGLKNNEYLLKYQSSLIGGSKDMNLDYLELTIKTTNKEGKTKEIKLNITSNGTNSSGVVGNSSKDDSIPCEICGKPTDPQGNHLDGTFHTEAEINAWVKKNYPDNNVKDNNKKSNNKEKPPTEEPLPPSDDYGSGGTGGGYYYLLINLFKNYEVIK